MQLDWDRGTLLVRGVTTPPPTAVWDERVGAFRALASSHAALASLPGAIDAALAQTARPPPFPPPELRPYQAEALSAWETAQRRGLVVMPTGAGKTRLAVAAIASVRAPSLVLVPTRVLLDPWAAALRDAGVPFVGRYGDGERTDASVVVATFAGARANAEWLGNRFRLLVVDEAHHFGGGAIDEVLEMFVAPLRLGLSATPPTDAARLGRLRALIGSIVFRTTIDDLAGRWLAPFRLVTRTVPLSPDEHARFEALAAVWRPVLYGFFAERPTARWPDFVKHCGRSERGRRALATWRQGRAITTLPEAKLGLLNDLLLRHATSRVLVFAGDAVAALHVARSCLVPALTSEVRAAERRKVLAAFAAGELRAIVSARVLNEGVDIPSADVAIIVGSSQGSREYVQRVGRVLRPAPGKEALIYEVVTEGTREARVAWERPRG